MYTNNARNNNGLIFMPIIVLILIIAMFVNIQNAYAESDILGIYNSLEESINIVNSMEEEIIEPEVIKDINAEESITQMNTYISPVAMQLSEDLEAKRQEKIEERERLAKLEAMTVTSTQNIYYNEINVHTDLSVMTTINADQMNEILDYWGKIRGGNMPFAGKGQMFIDAAKESGLDPVYILAHAAFESGWGTSYYAKEHHNYFGIGAFDRNPDNAINYGHDGMSNGIIKGAKWIADNYYSVGQTSLYGMRYSKSGTHNYCSSTTWADNIASIMRTSYKVIQS